MMSTRDQHQPFGFICSRKKMLAHKEGHDVVSRAMNEENGNVDVGDFVNRIKALSCQQRDRKCPVCRYLVCDITHRSQTALHD